MKFSLFSTLTLALSALPFAMAQNRTATNNLGTNPNQRFQLNQDQALRIITAAAAKSAEIKIPINVAVTDPAGLLLAFLRTDNAYLGSIDIAIKKARTVSLFNGAITTGAWYNLTQPGQSLYAIQETNGGLIVFGGGVPCYVDGYFVGSVGVSGGTTDEDVQIATAGVDAVGSTEGQV
ncbi:hypothetical protein H2201_004568 [Coniosporium apollinis]|uniref:DUF336-domain-containing protein n=1 Tax=Coniosporium apollinis TaxID=61459 RepID=A0ABQ9NUG0_9PEZI|nr:hypothetical protein H2201_004568 [Coniosporium apollinis]